jgi:GMP synthase (glutamine-hydrolysing)
MSKSVVALRHVHFEDLGAFEAPLLASGYTIRYCDMGVDDPGSFGTPDLLAMLGGPIGAYEDEVYPFLLDELSLVASRLSAGLPIIGICLGAQLIARALGARVYPARAKEIGWKPLTLTEAGQELLEPLVGQPVLHWHGDTFDLPEGAQNLASTDICAHQAFSYGAKVLAFQFHAEANFKTFERWLIGHAVEIAGAGVAPPDLRVGAQRYALESARCGQFLFGRWLAQLSRAGDER